MKKSQSVPMILVASMAAVALSGCGANKQVRRCVDQQGNVLPDTQCVTSTGYRSGGAFIYPRWVYGGTSSGRKVTGFSSTPSSSADIVDSKGTVVRKGFGSSRSSSGSRMSFGG